MADDKKQPIVIKKIVKGGGHHGGAWKVAYADFVTAMMAFFLLLWLLGISDDEMRGGISAMFKNPSPLIGPGGASTSMIKLGGTKDIPRGDGPQYHLKSKTDPEISQDERTRVKQSEEEAQKLAEERRKMDQLLVKLKASIEKSKVLKDFKDQLLIEIMPEGLRIQVLDKEKRPMFDSGSEKLKPYTRVILRQLAKVIAKNSPNKISVTGHTDSTRFGRGIIEYETVDGGLLRKTYSNWELSADRANAARRELVKGGMPERQIGRVVGLGSSVLFDKTNSANPINRRISLIVMNNKTYQSMVESEGKRASEVDVKKDNAQRVQ